MHRLTAQNWHPAVFFIFNFFLLEDFSNKDKSKKKNLTQALASNFWLLSVLSLQHKVSSSSPVKNKIKNDKPIDPAR